MDRSDNSMILYRSVSLQEMELIYDSGMKAFPARLSEQPIFYPVLDLEYARQVASNWNAQHGKLAGYVTQFKVEDQYMGQFETHTVGDSQHQEFWIPAEDIEEFNQHIIGHIKILEVHFGDGFQGFVPEKFGLQGKNIVEQFTLLTNSYMYRRMDFYLEIKRNHKAVFLNYPFWQKYDFKNPGLKDKILQAIKEAWLTSFPQIPLPLPPPVDEESRHVKLTDSHILEDPVPEDITPVDQPDSYSLVHPVHEETPPVTQTDSHSLGNAVGKINTPPEQAGLHPWVNPFQENTTHVKQADSHIVQGIKLALSGMYSEAVEVLSKGVEEDPEDVVAHTSLGIAFHRLGEDEHALACYEAALRLDPNYAEAHYFRANILFTHGDVREAIAGYRIAIGLKPELIEGHAQPEPQDRLTDFTRSPAEMYWIAKPARRILDLNKSLETNARQANLFKERATQYFRLRNYEQAIADYSSYLELQPEDANVLHLRGQAYEQIGQLDYALKDYQQAIAIDPQLSDVYINRGVTFGKMGNFRQSITSLTESIRLAPKNPDAYFNRGMTYFQLVDYERAIADFTRAIQLSPKDEDAYYWRGISNEGAGNQREAIADYRQFLALSQNPSARAEVEQKLRQWNEGMRNGVSSRSAVSDDRPKENQSQPAKTDQNLDLYALLVALGERALNSIWFGSSVDCYGEKAEELYAFTDQNRPIQGRDFLHITLGIRQTMEGDFAAFDPDSNAPWVFIRAWEGKGFYIETNDPKGKERLKSHFQSIEEVDGAPPPYEGLFIHIG